MFEQYSASDLVAVYNANNDSTRLVKKFESHAIAAKRVMALIEKQNLTLAEAFGAAGFAIESDAIVVDGAPLAIEAPAGWSTVDTTSDNDSAAIEAALCAAMARLESLCATLDASEAAPAVAPVAPVSIAQPATVDTGFATVLLVDTAPVEAPVSTVEAPAIEAPAAPVSKAKKGEKAPSPYVFGRADWARGNATVPAMLQAMREAPCTLAELATIGQWSTVELRHIRNMQNKHVAPGEVIESTGTGAAKRFYIA